MTTMRRQPRQKMSPLAPFAKAGAPNVILPWSEHAPRHNSHQDDREPPSAPQAARRDAKTMPSALADVDDALMSPPEEKMLLVAAKRPTSGWHERAGTILPDISGAFLAA